MESLPFSGIDFSALTGPRKSKSITASTLGQFVQRGDKYEFKITEITWITGDRKEFAIGEW